MLILPEDGPADLGAVGSITGRVRGYPVPVLAAAILSAEGVSFLLVGSAALWLQGESVSVADADLVIEPGGRNLHCLREAIVRLAIRPHAVPRIRDFPLLHLVSVSTSYGRVDCLLERGRRDWDRLRRAAVRIPVADASVLTTARADARELRQRFRE